MSIPRTQLIEELAVTQHWIFGKVLKGDLPLQLTLDQSKGILNGGSSENKSTNYNLKSGVESFEQGLIYEALGRAGGNRRKTALLLGISLRCLFYKLEKYGINSAQEIRVSV